MKSYRVKNGAVYLDKVKVGSLSANGDFRVSSPEGRIHTGNISTLIRADVQRQVVGDQAGPTGRLRVGPHACDVRGGAAWCAGQRVGQLGLLGDYAIEVQGDRLSGNLNRTPGAIWLVGRIEGGSSARIDVSGAGRAFTAIDGVIYEAGEEIGWLLPDGRFRAVTLEGDQLEGTLQNLAAAKYLRLSEA